MFVVLVALDGLGFKDQLKNRYLGDEDVKSLVARPVLAQFLQKNTKERMTR